MRIALVNNLLQLGGAETVARQLWKGIASAGHAVSLQVADGKHFPFGVRPLYPRLLCFLSHTRFSPFIERHWPRYVWTDSAFRRLAHSSVDLVHVHNFAGRYAAIESLAYLAARKPVVWTFHGFWGITGGCVHPKECERYQLSCGACPHLGEWPLTHEDRTAEELKQKLKYLATAPLHIIAPSRFLAVRVCSSQVGQRWKVHHIPNGVDLSRFRADSKHSPILRRSLGLSANARVVLVATRNFRDPEKGFATVRDAIAALDPRDVQIVLVGEHSDWARDQIAPQFACIETGYLTSRELLAVWMEAADIFLFASAAENFPCIILEAMAAGCCVVATPSGGVVEQIAHGKTGFLAANLTGEALAKVLREAIADSTASAAIGAAARGAVCAEFSESTMVERHLRLYEQILSK
jgi:putative colanic acid biosynthesis glycosyltransferase